MEYCFFKQNVVSFRFKLKNFKFKQFGVLLICHPLGPPYQSEPFFCVSIVLSDKFLSNKSRSAEFNYIYMITFTYKDKKNLALVSIIFEEIVRLHTFGIRIQHIPSSVSALIHIIGQGQAADWMQGCLSPSSSGCLVLKFRT